MRHYLDITSGTFRLNYVALTSIRHISLHLIFNWQFRELILRRCRAPRSITKIFIVDQNKRSPLFHHGFLHEQYAPPGTIPPFREGASESRRVDTDEDRPAKTVWLAAFTFFLIHTSTTNPTLRLIRTFTNAHVPIKVYKQRINMFPKIPNSQLAVILESCPSRGKLLLTG